ncbi:DUF4912 domain-containing protein [Botrimarina sp.]|uniref:DUF4912 domain-containing protein n=1 Tax=Botrimarina sp. TaxID=2795802 RepID=UPI0032EDEF69
MTPAKLRTHTAKDLAQMARQQGIAGWHSMRKSELIAAIAAAHQRGAASESRSPDAEIPRPRQQRPTAAQRRLAELQTQRRRLQDIADPNAKQDRLVLLVRDPYWLQLNWEITTSGVARARTALGQHWHGAEPVLRIAKTAADGGTLAARQVKIHGGVDHWYVDVSDPPSCYRAEIGYVDSQGRFYSLARSNEVKTPEPGLSEQSADGWSDVARNADRVFALSGGYSHEGPSAELREALEERLRRPLGRPSETRMINGAGLGGADSLQVELDAELLLQGHATPHTHLTVQGEPVSVGPDGCFAVKLPFPDRRQVIPVVASSADGLHQKTIIVGVDRNTKSLEPRRRESSVG